MGTPRWHVCLESELSHEGMSGHNTEQAWRAYKAAEEYCENYDWGGTIPRSVKVLVMHERETTVKCYEVFLEQVISALAYECDEQTAEAAKGVE